VEFCCLSSFVKKGLKKFLSIAVKVGVLQTSKNDPQIVSFVDSRCVMETQLVKELYNQTVEQYRQIQPEFV
jgi:hypothetical protein